MKKIIISMFLVASLFTLNSCTKKTAEEPPVPFQGPLNPGYEDDLGSAWLSNFDYFNSRIGNNERITGTGFMPTKGSYFLNIIWGSHRWDYLDWTGQVYQESINFNSSSKMIFDYSIQGPGTAKILFTSNGTETLWTSNTIVVGSKVEKTSETITLPTLPDNGKLIIQFFGTSANASFQIDNIRVQ